MANIEFIQTVETMLPTLTLSEAAASHLGGISVTGIYGPPKSGKHSVLLEATTAVATWDTTRQTGEFEPTDKHNHISSDSELQEVVDTLRQGEYAHAGIYNGEFYGVRASEYTKTDTGVILVDMARHRIHELRAKEAFEAVHEVMIVADGYNRWQTNFIGALGYDVAKIAQLMDSTEKLLVESLEGADAHDPQDGLYIVANQYPFFTAKIIDAYANNGDVYSDVKEHGYNAAEAILNRIKARPLGLPQAC